MYSRIFVSLLILVSLSACKPNAATKSKEIEKLEMSLLNNAKKDVADTTSVKILLADYERYISDFPNDSLTPVYLMKSADFYRYLALPDKAIANFHRVYNDFPSYPKVDLSLFLEGYTYENEKHDLAKAHDIYEAYLLKYPNTKLARSVQFALRNLGKTPEQIMSEMDSSTAIIASEKRDTTKRY